MYKYIIPGGNESPEDEMELCKYSFCLLFIWINIVPKKVLTQSFITVTLEKEL